MRTLLLISLLLLCAVGCAGTPRVSALHDPLYRAQNHTSTITATAQESQDGISQVSITAIVGEITACQNGVMPSLIPCRQNASAVGVVCTYANVTTEVTCALPINITPRRIITYTATAQSANGKTRTSGAVTYAGGAPLTQATISFPFININIPWETARPIVWRTDAPSTTAALEDKINFGLVPDEDMPNYLAFTNDLEPMVLSLFYTDTNQYTRFTRTWKNVFNVWAGPEGADGEGCTRTFNAPASTVRAAFDGTAILHRNAFRDCASISLGGGAGTSQTNLGDAAWVLLHEAGHFMFGLGDEYDGGGNWAASDPKNVFDTEAACQTASTANGLPTAQCAEIGSTGKWRNDDGNSTTMEDRTLNSDFRTLSGKAVNNLIAECFNGDCY